FELNGNSLTLDSAAITNAKTDGIRSTQANGELFFTNGASSISGAGTTNVQKITLDDGTLSIDQNATVSTLLTAGDGDANAAAVTLQAARTLTLSGAATPLTLATDGTFTGNATSTVRYVGS